jgi:hypothetical protein
LLPAAFVHEPLLSSSVARLPRPFPTRRRHQDSSAIARDVAQLFTAALSTLGGAAVRDAADALTVADFLAFVAAVHAHLLLADRHAYVVSGLCARVAAVTREEAAKRAAAKAAPAATAAVAGGDSSSPTEAARAIREARAAAAAAVAPSAGGGATDAASVSDDAALGRQPLTASLRDAVAGVLTELLDELEAASSSIQTAVRIGSGCKWAAAWLAGSQALRQRCCVRFTQFHFSLALLRASLVCRCPTCSSRARP